MRPTNKQAPDVSIDDLDQILSACGFSSRLWKGQRLYISGYGRDIKAYLQPDKMRGPLPADGYSLSVTSNWSAPRFNGLRCKGVMHAILQDLYRAGLISQEPPHRWQDVELGTGQGSRPVIQRYAGPQIEVVTKPKQADRAPPPRQPFDPYAALRALHQKTTNA